MRMYKRSEKSPRTKAHPPRTFQQKQPIKRVLSRSYQDMDFGENNSVKSIGSSYSNSRFEQVSSDFVSREALDDIGQQLSETIDENSMMKSRLHMELKERHILEMKIKDLTEKLLDARKGLQETGAALYKVQQATDALMKKRDQREIQLQKAQEVNAAQEARIVELEGKLSKAIDGTKVQATIGSFRKIIGEKDDIIRILEEQQYNTQTQLTKMKRESQRFADEKQELEQIINGKQKKISALEAAFRQLESKLSSGEMVAANGSGSPLKEIQTSLLDALNSPGREFSMMSNSGGAELKLLESRMAQLESQLKQASLNGNGNGTTTNGTSSSVSLSNGKSPNKGSNKYSGVGTGPAVLQQSAAATKAFDEAEQLLAEIELNQRLEQQKIAEEQALEAERKRRRDEDEQRKLMKLQQEQQAKLEAEAKEAVRLQMEQQQLAQQEQLRKQMELQKQQDMFKQQEFLKQQDLLKQQQEEQQRQFQAQQLAQQQLMEQEKQRQAALLMQQQQQAMQQQQALQQQQMLAEQERLRQQQMEQLKQQQAAEQAKFQQQQQEMMRQMEQQRQQQLFMQQQAQQAQAAQQAEMLRQQQLAQQQAAAQQQQQLMMQQQAQQQAQLQAQQQAQLQAEAAAKAQKAAEQQAWEEKQRQMLAQQKKDQEQLLLEQQQLRAIEDQRSPPKQRGKSMRASGGSMVGGTGSEKPQLGAPIVPQGPVTPSMAPAITPLAPLQAPVNAQNTPAAAAPAGAAPAAAGAAGEDPSVAQLRQEIADMTAQNKKTKAEINKFTEEFTANNGRKPTKDDRRVHAKDIFSSYHRTAREIKKKQKQLLKLQGGSSKSLKFSKNDDDDEDDSGDD